MVAREELANSESKNVNNSKSVSLNNIKNDFFEKGDTITLSLYVKNVNSNETQIEFTENNVCITFKTNDTSFLKQHNTEDANTQFKWNIQLERLVNASKCSYKINKSSIEICLSKHVSDTAKWTNVIKPNISIDNNDTKNESKSSVCESMSQTSQNITNSKNKKISKEPINRSRSASSSLSPSPSLNYANRQVKLPINQYSNYGYVGLSNLGNTCYMNAAIQCLINTTDLRDYFLETPQLFQKELNNNNSLGLNGRLAVAFAVLLKQLWRSNNNYVAPNQLRDLICAKYAHFRGYEQQDTHEFLCSLLSILHEDLNRVLKKPFYESGLECEDESLCNELKIANESWERFLSRENSIIVDNFYGQFKSKLICPECNEVSITFEPFNSLLVPIPSPKVSVNLIIMFNVMLRVRQPIRINLYLSGNETVQGLIDEVKNKFSELKNSTLLAFLLNKNKRDKERQDENEFGYEFDSNWSNISPKNKILSLESNKQLIIYEIENVIDIKEPILEIRVQQACKYPLVINFFDKCSFCNKTSSTDSNSNNNLRRCSRCFKSAYCNSECQRSDWKNHINNICNLDYVGLPFVLSLRKGQLSNNTIESLLTKMLLQMSSQTIDIENVDDNNYELELFNNEALKFKTINLTQVGEMFDNSINANNATNKSMHLVLKLQLKWNNNKNFKVKTNLKKINDLYLNQNNDSLVSNLNDCLKLFTQPEKLTSDNPWYCSKCKKHQEATKRMSLWKLPKYLIITLKRFQATKASDSFGFSNSSFNYLLQNRVVYNKLNTFVDFPLNNLDLSKYVKESNMAQNESVKNDNVYDLYGVINHLGQSLYLGHYTAFARTHDKLDSDKDELSWRLFDDSTTMTIKNEEQIVSKDAYVLLYRLRSRNVTEENNSKTKETKVENKEEIKTSILTDGITSEDENYDSKSEESEQFNSTNQNSDDNISLCDSDEKPRTNYTNLNDID